jgi:hypothetical protein
LYVCTFDYKLRFVAWEGGTREQLYLLEVTAGTGLGFFILLNPPTSTLNTSTLWVLSSGWSLPDVAMFPVRDVPAYSCNIPLLSPSL